MDIWNYEGHNMASLQSTALCRNAIQNVTFRSSFENHKRNQFKYEMSLDPYI